MRGEEGKWQASFLSSKFEIMFTFFQLEEKKFKGAEGKGTNGRKQQELARKGRRGIKMVARQALVSWIGIQLCVSRWDYLILRMKPK